MQFHTLEPSVGIAVVAKLIMLHPFAGTGPRFEGRAGLDYLADKYGYRIYYPSADGGNWMCQHGMGPAMVQIRKLKANIAETPPLPTIWAGYSDGCEMSQLCVVDSESNGDKTLAGGLFYAGRLQVSPIPLGTCPIMLAHNTSDRYVTADVMSSLVTTWTAAGNAVSPPLTGFGDHMNLWDHSLNPTFESWMTNAVALWQASNPLPA